MATVLIKLMYTTTVILLKMSIIFLFLDDTSRCRLSFIPGVEGSDYINANYIDVCHASIYRDTTFNTTSLIPRLFNVAQEKRGSLIKHITCVTSDETNLDTSYSANASF